jgi:hypothetical protein
MPPQHWGRLEIPGLKEIRESRRSRCPAGSRSGDDACGLKGMSLQSKSKSNMTGKIADIRTA